jgi:hypothetical protein
MFSFAGSDCPVAIAQTIEPGTFELWFKLVIPLQIGTGRCTNTQKHQIYL